MASPLRNKVLRCVLLFSILLSVFLVAAPGASANVRLPSGNMPLYLHIPGVDKVQHDDEWAVTWFYRPPSCVPADFNLLNFVDFGASACTPPTTTGFEIWSQPGVDVVPKVWHLTGLGAVPVWFVSWPELQAAMADGVLTIGELEALPSLRRGTADAFKLTVRNDGFLSVVVFQMIARGTLEDGRSFDVETVTHQPVTPGREMPQNTRIVFR